MAIERSTRLVAIGSGIVVGVVFIAVIGILFLNHQVKTEVKAVRGDIANLQAQAQRLADFRGLLKRVGQLDSAVGALRKNRPVWNSRLCELTKTLPAQIHLERVSFEMETKRWEIAGTAPSHQLVSEWGSALQKSAYFGRSVIGKSTIDPEKPGVVRCTFSLTPEGGDR